MKEYRNAYQEFSAVAHGMWNHVSRHNMVHCENPLHQYHRVPLDPDYLIQPDVVHNAAMYVRKLFDRFDETFGIDVEVPSAYSCVESLMKRFHKEGADEEPPGTYVEEESS